MHVPRYVFTHMPVYLGHISVRRSRCISAHMSGHISKHMLTCLNTCLHSGLHTRMHTCQRTFLHTCHIYFHACTRVYRHVCKHIYPCLGLSPRHLHAPVDISLCRRRMRPAYGLRRHRRGVCINLCMEMCITMCMDVHMEHVDEPASRHVSARV